MTQDERRNEQLARAAKHAAGIGIGWFTMTLLARQLIDRANDIQRGSYHDKLKDYVNARYLVITPDLSGKPDEASRSLGVPSPKVLDELETKSAEEQVKTDDNGPSMVRKVTDRFINPVPVPAGPVSPKSWLKAFTSGSIHPWHMVLTIAAAMAGVGAGSIISNKLSNKREGDALDTRISTARGQLDQLLAAEYRRTRGLDKTAEEKDTRGIFSKSYSMATKSWLIYAAGVAALTYAVTKNAMDERDPNRARLKALKEYARTRAIMSGAPQLNEDPNDPGFRKLMTPSQGALQ